MNLLSFTLVMLPIFVNLANQIVYPLSCLSTSLMNNIKREVVTCIALLCSWSRSCVGKFWARELKLRGPKKGEKQGCGLFHEMLQRRVF